MVAFIRGLESIAKALAKHQGKEYQQAWTNSSVKSGLKDLGAKVEEVVSDAIVKQSSSKVHIIL